MKMERTRVIDNDVDAGELARINGSRNRCEEKSFERRKK